MTAYRRVGQAAAVGLVAALAGGGLMISPATAAEAKTVDAPVVGDAYEAFVAQAIQTDDAINAIAINADGNIVIGADFDQLEVSTKAKYEAFDNVVFSDREPADAIATSDVVGGAGYYVDVAPGQGSVCSFGFSAWTPTGGPAVLTAGHCGDEGMNTVRTLPSEDDAPKFPEEPTYTPAPMGELFGTFAFSQFGGPNGSLGGPDAATNSDIAAIDVVDPSVTLRPFVSDWSTWASEDLSASGTVVKDVGQVEIGDPVTRSGRTTGSHSGNVLELGQYQIRDEAGDLHWVDGFVADVIGVGGDSGGSYVSGTTAVGIVSGAGSIPGVGDITIATNLLHGLEQMPGYTVMVLVEAPAVTSATTLPEGSNIAGTVEAGRTLEVTVDGVTTTVTPAANGSWSFPAPAPGTYTYSLVATDGGFNRSTETSYTVTVEKAALAAPVIVSPVDGFEIEETYAPNTITGTGVDGAEVTVYVNDVAVGTATVTGGTWLLTLDERLAVGTHTISAAQTLDGETSALSSTVSVTVTPYVEPTQEPTPQPTDEPTTAPTEEPGGEGEGGNNGDLPATGLDSGATLTYSLLGFGVLAAGAVVLLMARKRSQLLAEGVQE